MAVPIGLDEHFRHRYSLYPGDDQSGNSTLSNKSVLAYDMLANMRVSGRFTRYACKKSIEKFMNA